jgi:transposase
MIALPSNVRVWLACGHTDMRRGFDGLASQVQQHLGYDPFDGQFFVFRGKRGDLIKIYPGTARDCACLPSGSRKAASSGRRQKRARCR